MADPEIKIKRCADKENLKKLMRYIKATFANKSEVNEKFYTKEQIDTMLESEVVNLLSNYYTKKQIDIMLNTAGSDKYGDDTQGGLSFYTAVERAPGYDGTSQITIAEDSNTVEDE